MYTRPSIVSLVLDLAGYNARKDLSKVRVVDIGCGYGQFLGEVARRLADSCARRGLTRAQAAKVMGMCLRGVEVDATTATSARNVVDAALVAQFGRGEGVEGIVLNQDFLATQGEYDLIVGNLPYVKYDLIPKLPGTPSLDDLRTRFSTFRGRADYSVAFMQHLLGQLAPGGQAAVITSNRFTQAEYGQELRAFLAKEHVEVNELDLSGIRAFDENVSAYASAFLLSKRKGRPESHYVRLHEITDAGHERLVEQGLRNVRTSALLTHSNRGPLPLDGAVWSPLPTSQMKVLKRLVREFPSLTEAGFMARKGPATGADDVFVRPLADFPKPLLAEASDQLLPLFHSGSDPNSKTPDRVLLSTYSSKGQVKTWSEQPSSVQRYLEDHATRLKQRHIVKVQERDWWETIDPVRPEILSLPKVLVPDLKPGSATMHDEGAWFPAHTVVAITGDAKQLPALREVLASPIAHLFRLWKTPGLRNETPRASPKVLSQCPLPSLAEIREGDPESVYQAFGLKGPERAALTA